jgi:hypothetical protein
MYSKPLKLPVSTAHSVLFFLMDINGFIGGSKTATISNDMSNATYL